MEFIKKLKSFIGTSQANSELHPPAIVERPPRNQDISDDFTTEGARLSYAQNVYSNKTLPTNFSITLGVAPCNHTCLFCPQSVEKPRKKQWLDLKLLEKVLNEIPEENLLLNISSYTETLLTPHLIDAVKLMKRVRPKLQIAMASNGSLFREEVVAGLIDNGLDHYSYSFDAANKEDYKKMMQADHFDRVWKNLDRLVEMRAERNSNMKITTHIMGFKGKERDFEKFKEYWEPKVDAVIWRRVGNWGDDNMGLQKNLENAGFVSAHETPKKRFPCTSIFMHFKIQYDGHYYPCVSAVPAYDKHLVPSLGHASEITFMEAWQKLSDMRQAHLEQRWDEYDCCARCNIWSLWDNYWEEKTDDDGKKTFHLPDVEIAK